MGQIDIGIDELIVTEPENGSNIYNATPKDKMKCCPYCQSDKFILNGKKTRTVHDILLDAQEPKKIKLKIFGHRYQCQKPGCERIFLDRYTFVFAGGHYSNRFIEHIQELASSKRTFKSIAEEYEVSKDFVISCFEKGNVKYDESKTFEVTPVINICQLTLKGIECTLISDVFRDTVLELSQYNEKAYLKDIFLKLVNRNEIRAIVASFLVPKNAVTAIFPKVPIVVNSYYTINAVANILKIVQDTIKERNPEKLKSLAYPFKLMLSTDKTPPSYAVRKKRKELFILYPELKGAFDIFCEFKNIYNNDLGCYAEEYFDLWIENATRWVKKIKRWLDNSEKLFEISNTIDLISHWKREILLYWFFKTTVPNLDMHSYTLNELIKNLIKKGRKYSFEVIRGKLQRGIDHEITVNAPNIPDLDCGIRKVTDPVSETHSHGVSIIKLLEQINNNPDFFS